MLSILFSVLEQFQITKFSLNYVGSIYPFKTKGIQNLLYFFDGFKLYYSRRYFGFKSKFYKIRRFYVRFIRIIQSFFAPNLYSTKNYVYGRIMHACLKNYFRSLIRNKSLYLHDLMLK